MQSLGSRWCVHGGVLVHGRVFPGSLQQRRARPVLQWIGIGLRLRQRHGRLRACGVRPLPPPAWPIFRRRLGQQPLPLRRPRDELLEQGRHTRGVSFRPGKRRCMRAHQVHHAAPAWAILQRRWRVQHEQVRVGGWVPVRIRVGGRCEGVSYATVP